MAACCCRWPRASGLCLRLWRFSASPRDDPQEDGAEHDQDRERRDRAKPRRGVPPKASYAPRSLLGLPFCCSAATGGAAPSYRGFVSRSQFKSTPTAAPVTSPPTCPRWSTDPPKEKERNKTFKTTYSTVLNITCSLLGIKCQMRASSAS
eukprot:GHVT01073920.1.p1 GENE.GHVT01073920.1~~GHVT01073920.1.p1  ORF type:complete len:150 (-),score=23.52 GHVT01073920.1:338-787(-)